MGICLCWRDRLHTLKADPCLLPILNSDTTVRFRHDRQMNGDVESALAKEETLGCICEVDGLRVSECGEHHQLFTIKIFRLYVLSL